MMYVQIINLNLGENANSSSTCSYKEATPARCTQCKSHGLYKENQVRAQIISTYYRKILTSRSYQKNSETKIYINSTLNGLSSIAWLLKPYF